MTKRLHLRRPCAVRPEPRPSRRQTLLLSVTLSLGILIGSPRGGLAGNDFVLIRNAKNPTTGLPRVDIKDMAVGKKKTWSSGAAVVLVIGEAGSPELEWFATAVIGASAGALMTKIKQEVFKGELRKPVMAATDKDCLAAVAADPGAFGVVSAATAKALPAEVALLSVQ